MENIDSQLGILIQTSGIFIALIFVVASYRLQSLKKLMVGQGMTTLINAERGEYDIYKTFFPFCDDTLDISSNFRLNDPILINRYSKYIKRLSGSIQLEEVYGIEEMLIRLTKAELEFCKQHSKKPGRTGFARGGLPRFIITKNHLSLLKRSTIILFILLSGSIMVSLFFNNWGDGPFYVANILLILGVLFTIVFVLVFFTNPIGQENYKKKQVENLRKSDPKISEIYKNAKYT